jgi:hypothetical protein
MSVSFIIFLATMFFSVSTESNYVHKKERYWQVTGNSKLYISGLTNVNEFSCNSVGYSGKDNLREIFQESTGYTIFNGEILMKAAAFDCGNSIMTKDFAKTVKAEEFPEIKIRFINLVQTTCSSTENPLKGSVEISLAGKSKLYSIDCIIQEESDKVKYLVGSQTFFFSDFDLAPPSKFLGAIKVKDSVKVNFEIMLKGVKQ